MSSTPLPLVVQQQGPLHDMLAFESLAFSLSSEISVNCTSKMVHDMHTRHSIGHASNMVQMLEGICWLMLSWYCSVPIIGTWPGCADQSMVPGKAVSCMSAHNFC
jgi:hypothetical protein